MQRLSLVGCLLACTLGALLPPSTASADTSAPNKTLEQVAEQRSQRRVTFEQNNRQSGDLRLRILFSQQMVFGTGGAVFHDIIPLSALVESARGSTDPLVLELLLGRCSDLAHPDPSACDPVDLARRWTAVDAQNAVAWIELATVLEKAGDKDAADEAWDKAGRASTLRDFYYPLVRLVLAAYPVDPDPRVRYLDLTYSIGLVAAVPDRWMWDARTACKSQTLRTVCSRIADMAFRDGDAIHTVQAGRLLTAPTQQERGLRASRQQTEDALKWAMSHLEADTGNHTLDATDLQAVVRVNQMLEDVVTRGDVTVARDELRSLHVSEAEGARRYQVYMAALTERARSH
jgi:hypothetical protein